MARTAPPEPRPPSPPATGTGTGPGLGPVLAGAALVAVAGGALAAYTALTARRIERGMPAEGRFLQAGGARLHYVDQGAGPPVVMIHGLGGQLRHFTYALAGRLADDHRVVAVDRPGAGRSDAAPGGSQTVRAQARAVADFIRALGLEKPLVVGHSLGGAVALAMALDHPELVGGLALIAPLTQPVEDGSISPVFRALAIRSPLVRAVVSWTLATPLTLRRGAAALETVFGPEPVVEDFAGRGGGALGLRPRAFQSSSRDLLAAGEDLPGMVARYPSLAMPVGVLYGADDRLLDAELHGRGFLAQLPAAELEVVPDAGHMILMTQPDLTADFVRRQAARVDRSR